VDKRLCAWARLRSAAAWGSRSPRRSKGLPLRSCCSPTPGDITGEGANLFKTFGPGDGRPVERRCGPRVGLRARLGKVCQREIQAAAEEAGAFTGGGSRLVRTQRQIRAMEVAFNEADATLSSRGVGKAAKDAGRSADKGASRRGEGRRRSSRGGANLRSACRRTTSTPAKSTRASFCR